MQPKSQIPILALVLHLATCHMYADANRTDRHPQPTFFQECLVQLHNMGVQLRGWKEWLNPSAGAKTIGRWAKGVGAEKDKLHLRENKYGIEQSATFLIPKTDEASIEKYEKEVVPKTIAFVMTQGWYANYPKEGAPFHAYVRIGDRVFRITTDHKIVEQSYGATLRDLLSRDGVNAPQTETREMVFTVSDEARKALLEYYEGRVAGHIGGKPIETVYDVGAVAPETYDESGRKVEMCVTFSLSCMEPRAVAAIPGLAQFQREANFHMPALPSGRYVTAKEILGYLTLTAKPDAVVIWANGAHPKREAAVTPETLTDLYRNFLATMGGKRLEIEVAR